MLPRSTNARLAANLVRSLYHAGHRSKIKLGPYTNVGSKTNDIIRVLQRNKLIRNEDKPLFRHYWDFLSNNQANFPETVLGSMPLDSIIQFVQANKQNSSTVRGLYRRELIFNWDKNTDKVNELIEKLQISEGPINSKQDVLALCINDSLETRDVIIAAEIYILYYTLNTIEPLNDDLCRKIVTALAFEHPRYDHIHLMKYLNLHDLYDTRNERIPLTQTQIVSLCNKAIALEYSPILTKQTLNRLMDIELTSSEGSRSNKIIAAYHLIEKDCHINNVAGVYFTWTAIQNYYTSIARHDPRIIHKIIKLFTRHKAYRTACKEIISNLPPEYYSNNPLILPTIIDYATKVGNLSLAKELMVNVNKHLLPQNTQIVLFSKRCLSSFLRMHLKFKDSKGVDRVLKQIQDSFGKHSEENLLAIVAHLVEVKSSESLTKAVQLVEKIPLRKALSAYGSIINKIVEWQIASDERFDAKSMPILNKLMERAHRQDPLHKNRLWNIIASLFIKKIVHYRNFQRPNDKATHHLSSKRFNTTNLDLAKLIYIKSNDRNITPSDTDINPFANTSPQHVLLKITEGNRLIILRNIALAAIKGQRKDIFLWCCSNLYQAGMPTKELLLDWNTMLNNEIRNAQFVEVKQMEEELSIQGLPFLRKAFS